MDIGRTIAALRVQKGLTQEALAGLTGTSQQHVSLIERGGCDVEWTTATRMLAALGRALSLREGGDSWEQGLPGGELIAAGLRDLARGRESAEALLVSIGAPRLEDLGFPVPAPLPSPELRLYERLSLEGGDAAHSRYNALVRRLVSFERAACAR